MIWLQTAMELRLVTKAKPIDVEWIEKQHASWIKSLYDDLAYNNISLQIELCIIHVIYSSKSHTTHKFIFEISFLLCNFAVNVICFFHCFVFSMFFFYSNRLDLEPASIKAHWNVWSNCFAKPLATKKRFAARILKILSLQKMWFFVYHFERSTNLYKTSLQHFCFVLSVLFSRFLPIEFSKYSIKITLAQYRYKNSSMPYISLPANRRRTKSNFYSKSMISMVSEKQIHRNSQNSHFGLHTSLMQTTTTDQNQSASHSQNKCPWTYGSSHMSIIWRLISTTYYFRFVDGRWWFDSASWATARDASLHGRERHAILRRSGKQIYFYWLLANIPRFLGF